MRGLSYILFFLFALLCAASPNNLKLSPEVEKETKADNIKVLKEAAKGHALKAKTRYALVEKWAPKGHNAYECVTGWSHVRLIVGTYESDTEFSDPKAFDLGTRNGRIEKGGQVKTQESDWRANHILAGAGPLAYWHKVATPSKYEFAGEVKDSMHSIKKKGMKVTFVRNKTALS